MTPAAPDLAPPVVVDRDELQRGIRRLGHEIASAYPDGVVLVAVLKGSVIFLADLVRAVPYDIAVTVDFLSISSYAPDTGRVRIIKDLDTDIHGRDVVLVEDIVDTGLTLAYIKGELERRGPTSVEVCALLDKSVRRVVPTPLRFVGFEIDDRFVLGYGLDHDERYRNIDRVVAGDAVRLRAEADLYVDELYGRGAGGKAHDGR